jgi:hypothetical protein
MRTPDHGPRPALPRSQLAPATREPPDSPKWQQVKARWDELRKTVAAYWSRLPAEDIQRLGGDRAPLVQLVAKYYALDQAGAEAQVNAWLAGIPTETLGAPILPPPAQTKDEQRAEGEGMGSVPGATSAAQE